MTKDEALKLALEALKRATNYDPVIARAITAIKEALAQPEYQSTADKSQLEKIPAKGTLLAQPEQEPVGLIESLKDAKPCCGEYETCWRACTPRGKFLGQRDAQRTWVGLTDEEIDELRSGYQSGRIGSFVSLARAIEAKLKEKNT